MVVAYRPEPMPLDDLVVRGVEWMRAGLTASEAAAEVIGSMEPDADALAACYRRGLAEYIQSAAYLNASTAQTPLAKRVKRVFGEKHIESQPRPSRVRFLFLDKPLLAANGRTKLLRLFTSDDLRFYGSISRQKGEGLIRTADMAERARALLAQREVETVGQLPDSDLALLEQGDWE